MDKEKMTALDFGSEMKKGGAIWCSGSFGCTCLFYIRKKKCSFIIILDALNMVHSI